MENSKGERIFWLDGLKLFAILLVVWGHVLPRLGEFYLEDKYAATSGWIYSFHMPLFMVLSGYVSHKLISGQGNLVRKFKQLIIPCITLAIICFLIRFDENFWYLKSLFLCYAIMFVYYKTDIKYRGILLATACFLFFPLIQRIPYLGSYKVDFMLPFFIMGMWLRNKSAMIQKRLIPLLLLTALTFVILECYWDSSYIWYNSRPNWIDYKAILKDRHLVFNLDNILMVAFRYVVGGVASCFFIFLFQYLFSCQTIKDYVEKISKWGGYSLHVYILQAFIVRLGMTKIPVVLSATNIYVYDAMCLLISIIVVVIGIFLAKLLERNLYVNRYIFGKLKIS